MHHLRTPEHPAFLSAVVTKNFLIGQIIERMLTTMPPEEIIEQFKSSTAICLADCSLEELLANAKQLGMAVPILSAVAA